MRMWGAHRSGPWALAYRPLGVGRIGGKWSRDSSGWLLTFGIRPFAVGVGWAYRASGGAITGPPPPSADTVTVIFPGGDRG